MYGLKYFVFKLVMYLNERRLHNFTLYYDQFHFSSYTTNITLQVWLKLPLSPAVFSLPTKSTLKQLLVCKPLNLTGFGLADLSLKNGTL